MLHGSKNDTETIANVNNIKKHALNATRNVEKIMDFVDELYKQRASWVKQYTDKFSYMGIYTTSPVEAAHSALKGNNCQIAKCSLATTFVQLDMVLANQNIKAVLGKGYSKFSADPFVLTDPMFRELVKVVSRFAIEKIREQIQMFKKEISDRSLRP
ncbi:hypothetical protein INT47_012152 [Mucor saturninus]|uniref:Uncharacterized protein n=1 Tax=Mucor saturninus TaxID=64648 RepID=A0A8H7UT14_9FUNG|nr:hypothetical protein INT47_012152 [Mucor saturninus]